MVEEPSLIKVTHCFQHGAGLLIGLIVTVLYITDVIAVSCWSCT